VTILKNCCNGFLDFHAGLGLLFYVLFSRYA